MWTELDGKVETVVSDATAGVPTDQCVVERALPAWGLLEQSDDFKRRPRIRVRIKFHVFICWFFVRMCDRRYSKRYFPSLFVVVSK